MDTTTTHTKIYLPIIDGLRGLAAFMVYINWRANKIGEWEYLGLLRFKVRHGAIICVGRNHQNNGLQKSSTS